jgi:hypothetical protein
MRAPGPVEAFTPAAAIQELDRIGAASSQMRAAGPLAAAGRLIRFVIELRRRRRRRSLVQRSAKVSHHDQAFTVIIGHGWGQLQDQVPATFERLSQVLSGGRHDPQRLRILITRIAANRFLVARPAC